MNPKRALLVSNAGWNLYNFRRPLARALRDRGLEPVFVSPRDEYVGKLEAEGFRWVELPMARASVNPFRETLALFRLLRIYQRERPVAVHHITIKCVLYGTISAYVARVPAVINAVTGLGHVFIGRGWKAALVRPVVKTLYRFALNTSRVRVIFQNADDLAVFRDLGLVETERAVLIRGSGIDLARFAPAPLPKDERPMVLVVARLLEEKGIVEFVEAARKLRARGTNARFVVAGGPDPGNPSCIAPEQLDAWRAEGAVEFLGHVDGIERLLAQALIVALPSYREGVPRTLLEAAAMARPLVTTDVAGCHEVVEHERNGLLVPARDAKALASAIERLLGDRALCERMGRAGREKVMNEFDMRLVIEQTLRVYDSFGVSAGGVDPIWNGHS